MIIRLQHIGLAVRSLEETSARYERLFGLVAQDLRKDQARGTQLDARIMLPNECWLHVVQNWNPESRVCQYLERWGEGLEHVALETDDIEGDVARLRRLGVPVFKDKIFNAPDGFEAFVYPDDAIGFTVELIQPHTTSWQFVPSQASNSGVLGLQHIGVVVRDLEKACDRLDKLFGLRAAELRTDQHYGDQRDVMVEPGNDRLWFHIVETNVPDHRMYQWMERRGEGLEHLCIEVADIRDAVKRVKTAGVPLYQHKIYLDRADGFEAFVYPEHNGDVAVELIEPYADSRGYRPRPGDPGYQPA